MKHDPEVRVTSTHVCGECGGLLTVAWGGTYGTDGYRLLCPHNPTHTSIRRVPTMMERYRAGEPLPIHVVNRLQDKLERRDTMTAPDDASLAKHEERPIVSREEPERRAVVPAAAVMLEIVTRRYAGADWATEAALAQFALYAMEVGLRPDLGELVPLPFRNTKTGQTSLELMVTTRGWRTLSARECPDLFLVAPAVEDVVDAQAKTQYGAEASDFVAIAIGRLRGDPDLHPLTGRHFTRVAVGRYRSEEAKRDKERKTPGGADPQNQARVRAERHWYERNLSQAPQVARAALAMVQQKVGSRSLEIVVQGEYVELPPEPAPKPPTPAPAIPKTPPTSIGDLFQRCLDLWGLPRSQVLTLLNLRTQEEIVDLGEAWATVLQHKG